MKRRYCNAFTLVELLVVIAIIAILAAILFPVFAQVREKARQSSCISNEKQILLAINMYTQDYDEHFPLFCTYEAVKYQGGPNVVANPQKSSLWNQNINPYVKNQQVFLCPDDPNSAATPVWPDPNPPTGIKPFHTSYIINAELTFNWFYLTPSLAAVNSPSSTVCITDGGARANTSAPWVTERSTIKSQAWILSDPTTSNHGAGCNPFDPNVTINYCATTDNPDWAAPAVRHSGIAEVGFTDGHVKAMRPEKFYYSNTPWLDYDFGGD